jgi:hypothetical protein
MIARKAVDGMIEYAMGHLPAVHKHDGRSSITPVADTEPNAVAGG